MNGNWYKLSQQTLSSSSKGISTMSQVGDTGITPIPKPPSPTSKPDKPTQNSQPKAVINAEHPDGQEYISEKNDAQKSVEQSRQQILAAVQAAYIPSIDRILETMVSQRIVDTETSTKIKSALRSPSIQQSIASMLESL